MNEPGLLSRQFVTTDFDGSVIMNEVWDLTAPGCRLPRSLADQNTLAGSSDVRAYKRQIRMTPEEYCRDVLEIGEK